MFCCLPEPQMCLDQVKTNFSAFVVGSIEPQATDKKGAMNWLSLLMRAIGNASKMNQTKSMISNVCNKLGKMISENI